MTHATFDQNAVSAQLRAAGVLNFALAKPCYRHDAFNILDRGTAPSSQPDEQPSSTPSSPRHNAVAGSSDWSMSCLPDTRSQQHACDYVDEEAVITEFLSGRQQASSRTSTAQSSCPQPHRQLSAVNASNRSAGCRERHKLVPAALPGCTSAGVLNAWRCRAQQAAFTAYRKAGMSRAGSHKAGAPAALVAHVQCNGSPDSASQDVAQLLPSCDGDVTGPSYGRQHINSLQSQHASSKAAHKLQHRAVHARSNRSQGSGSYTGALRKRQAVKAQAQHVQRPVVQLHTGAVSSGTAPDLSDPHLKYKALLLRNFKQQLAGHCQSQRPETTWVSGSNNSTGHQSTSARTLLGVHADAVQRVQPLRQAATAATLRPQRISGSINSVSPHQTATSKGKAAVGRAMLFEALNAVTAANERAAAALSAAARQGNAAARVSPYVAVDTSKAMLDDALIQMVTGWYRTAGIDSSEQYVPAQRVASLESNKQQQQQQSQQRCDQQQWHPGAVEPTVVPEPSSNSTWSDGYPCSARCMCGVGCSWVGRHPSQQQQQQSPLEQVSAGTDKKAATCEQHQQSEALQHKAGDKVVSIAVLAGVEQSPLQELAKASSLIDELQHGLVDLRWTAEKLSHGDEVPVPLRQRYGSPGRP